MERGVRVRVASDRAICDLHSQPNASAYECVFIFLKSRPSQMLMLIVVFRG